MTTRVSLVLKNLPANAGDFRGTDSIPGSGRSLVPGESPQTEELVGHSPQGCKEWDTTKAI